MSNLKITIDNIEVEVPAGINILEACRIHADTLQANNSDVPPAMCYYSKLDDSGGKCRVCLVRVGMPAVDPATKEPIIDPATGQQKVNFMPKPQASCRTPIAPNMVVQNLTSPEVLEARKGVVEFLLINHPLDCPICDQAGECHLQDLAYNHGTAGTRYEEGRRVFEKIDIGDKIKLHMTRCILCYRCTYVADQLTDKRVHGVINRGDHAEISTYIQNAVENDFSGNMIDVCPVGALTDKTFRFKSRVWFLKPMNVSRTCENEKCNGHATAWMFGNEIFRVTARKDRWGEVESFICNTCRYDKKDPNAWTIEGPAKLDQNSVITQNHYTLPFTQTEGMRQREAEAKARIALQNKLIDEVNK